MLYMGVISYAIFAAAGFPGIYSTKTKHIHIAMYIVMLNSQRVVITELAILLKCIRQLLLLYTISTSMTSTSLTATSSLLLLANYCYNKN